MKTHQVFQMPLALWLFLLLSQASCKKEIVTQLPGQTLNTEKGGSLPYVSISTTGQANINPDLLGVCTIDAYIDHSSSDPSFVQETKELGFGTLLWPMGTTANFTHVIPGGGDGYNLKASEFPAGYNINNFLSGVGAVTYGKDFNTENQNLTVAANEQAAFIANVFTGTTAELKQSLDGMKSNGVTVKRVCLGAELELGIYEYGIKDGYAYAAKCQPFITMLRTSYPEIKIDAWVPPSKFQNQKSKTWRTVVNGMDVDGVAQYAWYMWGNLGSLNESVFQQQLQNIISFAQQTPSMLSAYKTVFPGKPISIYQWGIKPTTTPSAIEGTMRGSVMNALAVSLQAKAFADYNMTSPMGAAYFIDLKQLLKTKTTTSCADYSFETFYEMFKPGGMWLPITVSNSTTLYAMAAQFGNQLKVMVTNTSSAATTLDKIVWNTTKQVSGNVTITQCYGTLLGDQTINKVDLSGIATGISLPGYSVTLIRATVPL